MNIDNSFYEHYGYRRCREHTLRIIADNRPESLAVEAANQINHLKKCLREICCAVESHNKSTNDSIALIELKESKNALNK
jgi:hypothetical protein